MACQYAFVYHIVICHTYVNVFTYDAHQSLITVLYDFVCTYIWY